MSLATNETLALHNKMVNDKIREDARQGILDEESIRLAHKMIEIAKLKSDFVVRATIFQLKPLFENNKDVPLKDIMHAVMDLCEEIFEEVI